MKLFLRIIIFGILLVAVGLTYIYWQSSRGILVIIQNKTDMTLEDTRIVLNTHGPNFFVGDLRAHTTTRTRVHAGGESDAELTFRTPNGKQVSAGIIGYFEGGYCGDVKVDIQSDLQIVTSENIKPSCY